MNIFSFIKKQFLLILFFQILTFSFNGLASDDNKLELQLEKIEIVEIDIEQIIKTNFTYGAVKIKNNSASKKYGSNYGFFILSKKKKDGFHLNLEGYFAFVDIKKDIPDGPRAGRDVIKELGNMSLKSNFETSKLCKMFFSQKKKQSFNKYNNSIIKVKCNDNVEYLGKVQKSKSVHNIFGVNADWSVHGHKLGSSGEFTKNNKKTQASFMVVLSEDVEKGVANVIPNYLKGFVIFKKMNLSKKLLSSNKIKEVVVKEDLESKKLAEERAEELKREKARRIAEEKERKILEVKTIKLAEEKRLAEEKAKKEKQIQLAALEKEKAEKKKLILEEKKKRDELEKKLATLEEENKSNRSKGNNVYKAKLPPEWMPFQNKMSIQQEQFCQLTDRFFKDMDKAIASRNDIRVNIVHQERQENLDALIPSGKISNWIFKVVKIEQVDDGSAAVVLSLHCKSFVGSGQVHTKSTWRKKSNKEWRATIPRDDRRFRELAKLGFDDFILGSGTLLEVNAFKPGQIETFYASQQIGEHPLTKDLNLEGELFLADLSYIAALN